MDFMGTEEKDPIFTRRSVRHFTNQKVEEEKVDRLLRAAMQAPSAMNQQPWEFIVMQDKARLEELAALSPVIEPLSRAPMAIVLLADENRLKISDAWEQDLGAATQNILLEAATIGLGAVWIGVATSKEKTKNVRTFFDLPDHIKAFSMVAFGYPEKETNRFIDRFDASRIRYEKW